MSQTMSKAACLIKTREHYIGFPPLFSHLPEGMREDDVEMLHEFVLEAMDSPAEIPDGQSVRRIVIGTGKYLVMGISGYLYKIIGSMDTEYGRLDDGNRPSLGFIGLVWNLTSSSGELLLEAFPEISVFQEVLREQILVHWMEKDYSKWGEAVKQGIRVPYQYSVQDRMPVKQAYMLEQNKDLNMDLSKTVVYPVEFEESLLNQAIAFAAEKKTVSLCTGLCYDADIKSSFAAATSDRVTDRLVLEHVALEKKTGEKADGWQVRSGQREGEITNGAGNGSCIDAELARKDFLFECRFEYSKRTYAIIDEYLHCIAAYCMNIGCTPEPYYYEKKLCSPKKGESKLCMAVEGMPVSCTLQMMEDYSLGVFYGFQKDGKLQAVPKGYDLEGYYIWEPQIKEIVQTEATPQTEEMPWAEEENRLRGGFDDLLGNLRIKTSRFFGKESKKEGEGKSSEKSPETGSEQLESLFRQYGTGDQLGAENSGQKKEKKGSDPFKL